MRELTKQVIPWKKQIVSEDEWSFSFKSSAYWDRKAPILRINGRATCTAGVQNFWKSPT